jgi:hypothetical protein
MIPKNCEEGSPMRLKVSLVTVVLGILALTPVCAASAAPLVTFKAKATPIPGFAGTGNSLGAGATFHNEFTIQGTEYEGDPPPLIGVKVFLPSGVVLRRAGFPTCPQRVIEAPRPRCPRGSWAGLTSVAEAFVTFGGERVEEDLSIEGFYSAGGGVSFAIDGRSPVSLAVVSRGSFTEANGGSFGPQAIFAMPLVSSVAGAPYLSTRRIAISLGSAILRDRKPIYSLRMPRACPRRHLALKAALTFAEDGNAASPVTVTANYKAPCPRSQRHRA